MDHELQKNILLDGRDFLKDGMTINDLLSDENPVFLGEHDETVAVVMPVEAYVAAAEKIRVLENVCQSLNDMIDGDLMDDDDFAREMAEEFGSVAGE